MTMELIFIYGPPGVGKLTVANALSSITGYQVFHNHIAIDLVKPVYGYGNKKSEDLIMAVNLSAIAVAVAKDSSIIFTYARPNDSRFIKNAVDIVESGGGRARFVQLKCDPAYLHMRIASRKGTRYSKITDIDGLRRFSRIHGPFRRIASMPGISVDTSKLSAAQTAARIAKALRLKAKSR